jgi:hypothetical protein
MQGIFKEYDELGQVVTDGRMKFWHPEIAP